MTNTATAVTKKYTRITASWLGNYELDVEIEDERFALKMEEIYLEDLENATEIVLDAAKNVRAPGSLTDRWSSGGSSAAAAGR